jgi:hypothetical protein
MPNLRIDSAVLQNDGTTMIVQGVADNIVTCKLSPPGISLASNPPDPAPFGNWTVTFTNVPPAPQYTVEATTPTGKGVHTVTGSGPT